MIFKTVIYLIFLSLFFSCNSKVELERFSDSIIKEENSDSEASLTDRIFITQTKSEALPILDNLDDVENADTAGYYHLIDGEGSERLYCGYWYGSQNGPTYCSFRFTLTQDIPDGAIIRNAFLTMRGKGVYSWDSVSDYFEIVATKTNSAPQVTGFDDVVGGLNGFIATNNIVRWPETGGLNWIDAQMTTPDLSTIIQELVDSNEGLEAGDSILLWLTAQPLSGNREVLVADFGHTDFNTQLDFDFDYEEEVISE